MTLQSPEPLRPDPGAPCRLERWSFMCVAAATFIGHRDRETVTTFPDAPRPCQSVGGWLGLKGSLPSSGHRRVGAGCVKCLFRATRRQVIPGGWRNWRLPTARVMRCRRQRLCGLRTKSRN